MHSLRRAATRASLTSTISTAASAAPKTQSISFALRSAIAVRCFSVAAPRAFSRSIAMRDEEQQPQDQETFVSERSAPPSVHCVFVQNYPFSVPREDISEAFSKFGEVVQIDMPPRRTYCFVYFKHADSVNAAIENVDGTFWHGRRIAVKASEPKAHILRPSTPRVRSENKQRVDNQYDGTPTNTLYIGNISFDATDVDLNQLFSVFKNVRDVRVAVDRATGWPRGFAHAEFKAVEDAQAGKDALEGSTLRGREVKVEFAPPRKEKSSFESRRDEAEAEAIQAEEQKKHQQNDWNA